MSAYIQGSLALEERINRSPETRNSPKETKKSTGLTTREKLLYLMTVIAFCLVAGWIAFRYSTAFELNSQIVQIETEIRQLEEHNASLKNEIAKLQDPVRLIESGIKLGLVPAGEVKAAGPGGIDHVAMSLSR